MITDQHFIRLPSPFPHTGQIALLNSSSFKNLGQPDSKKWWSLYMGFYCIDKIGWQIK